MSVPASMNAAFITAKGPPEAIVVGELPTAAPGPADVLVAVEAVAVNPVDTYIRSGRWQTPMPFPFVVGRDLVGTVAEGDKAGIFAPGERVWANSLGYDGRQGATSQYAVVPADRLYRLPGHVDPVTAVASLHPAATAFIGLHRRARLRAGDTVLVGGAAGSVGGCVMLFATAAGARVIATASPEDHDRCRRLGAETVFDYHSQTLADQVRSAAPDGVDVHWNVSGHGHLGDAAAMVRPGGRIVVTAGREPQPSTSWWPFYTRDINVIGFVISRAATAELAEAARAVNAHLTGPGFGIRIAGVLPLEQTSQAHAAVESGQRGRIVIAVGE